MGEGGGEGGLESVRDGLELRLGEGVGFLRSGWRWLVVFVC